MKIAIELIPSDQTKKRIIQVKKIHSTGYVDHQITVKMSHIGSEQTQE